MCRFVSPSLVTSLALKPIQAIAESSDNKAATPESLVPATSPLAMTSPPLEYDFVLARKYAKYGHQQQVIQSMLDYAQTRHAPGSKRDDTYSARFYDTLQELYHGASDAEKHDIMTTPTFYIYIAGGAEVEDMP